MKKILGVDIGKELCEAMGLPAKGISSIDIHVSAHELVTADVRMFVHDEQAKKLVELLRKYELRERTPANVTNLESVCVEHQMESV